MATLPVATIYNEKEFLKKSRITSLICGNTVHNNTTRMKVNILVKPLKKFRSGGSSLVWLFTVVVFIQKDKI
jgi:hypothetical protein